MQEDLRPDLQAVLEEYRACPWNGASEALALGVVNQLGLGPFFRERRFGDGVSSM
jgi:hypothetical protein